MDIIPQPTCHHRECMAHDERPMRSHNKISSTCRRSEMKQRKKITRVPNMQNLNQKCQMVNPQMSRQQNTNRSRHKMRNMLLTKDIMNIMQTRIERNVQSPLWCRVNSWENNITVINMRHFQWRNHLLPDSKRSVPCMSLNRSQNGVNFLTNRLIMIHGRQVPEVRPDKTSRTCWEGILMSKFCTKQYMVHTVECFRKIKQDQNWQQLHFGCHQQVIQSNVSRHHCCCSGVMFSKSRLKWTE
jgi:rhodanese-related sulfurtransferase